MTTDGRMRCARSVAVVVAVTAVTGMDAWWNQPGTREADVITFLLVGAASAALIMRHRWPVAAAVVCGSGLTAWLVLGHRGELLHLPSMVALYTVAVRGDRRRSVLVGVVAVAWSGGLGWLTGDRSSAPVTELLWPVVAVLLGEVVRGRRELREEYATRESRAAAEREQRVAQRIAHERLRITREFHDVVAHTMAAVNVQMGVAVAAFDQRPDAARAALAQARALSREAMRELRATVAVLRETGDGRLTEPAPGLAQLDSLVARVDGSAVRVSLHRDTGPDDVPAVAELTAYRIVQEALTNVIRHAHAGAAAVSVTRDGAMLRVEVIDDGVGAARNGADPGGYGLTGMAERVAAIGGHLRHGPVAGGGFRVYAELPIGPVQP
ncbi:MAG TPA: sensor histidine kinase [Micromonosporaceae bacterium]|nr:sensor histidine kinase [Micromonosporaceae bacterium]